MVSLTSRKQLQFTGVLYLQNQTIGVFKSGAEPEETERSGNG